MEHNHDDATFPRIEINQHKKKNTVLQIEHEKHKSQKKEGVPYLHQVWVAAKK